MTTTRTRLFVFTFKDGLLSRLAHDLRASMRDFEATIHERQVRARVRLESFSVDGVVRDGQLDTTVLSPAELRRIETTARDEVLQSHLHPEATFQGTIHDAGPGSYRVRGELTLHGVTRPVELDVEARGEPLTATVTLVPSRFGIARYRALAGALRLEDRVEVRCELHGAQASALLSSQTPVHLAP